LPSGTLFAAAISEQEVTRGHSKMDGDCVAFETDYQGELAEFAARMIAAAAGSPRQCVALFKP
jgi:hypothetical protein